jgi:hypothetical protein
MKNFPDLNCLIYKKTHERNMTMKRIYALPLIAALILCGCSKEITVIPQADIPSETAAKQTQPAETTETQAQTSAVSETIITADIPIDDDTDVFDDSEFSDITSDDTSDITDLADEELTDNTMTVTVMSVSENGFMAALSQDTFFGKKNDEVSIGLPYDHPEIESGCVLMITLSDDCEVMESYPMQISSRYVEYIEVLTYPDE